MDSKEHGHKNIDSISGTGVKKARSNGSTLRGQSAFEVAHLAAGGTLYLFPLPLSPTIL